MSAEAENEKEAKSGGESREMTFEEAKEDILDTLHENIEKIAEKIYAPDMDGWQFWIHGEIGSDEISFSDSLTQGTTPNSANYNKGEWLIKVPFMTELGNMTYEQEEEIKEKGLLTETITDHFLPEIFENWVPNKLTVWGFDHHEGIIILEG